MFHAYCISIRIGFVKLVETWQRKSDFSKECQHLLETSPATKCHSLPIFKFAPMHHTYILKVGVSGDRVSANFFHFPPKFRLRTLKPSRLHCTIASPSICRVCFVLNINTSYIDLLYFDNLLLKTPDLCNLRTFVAIFLSQFTHFFR